MLYGRRFASRNYFNPSALPTPFLFSILSSLFSILFVSGKRRADDIRPYESLRKVDADMGKRIATPLFKRLAMTIPSDERFSIDNGQWTIDS